MFSTPLSYGEEQIPVFPAPDWIHEMLLTSSADLVSHSVSSLPSVWKQKIAEWATILVSPSSDEHLDIEAYVTELKYKVSEMVDSLGKYRVSNRPMFSEAEREAIYKFVISTVYDADVRSGMSPCRFSEPDVSMTDLGDLYTFYEETCNSFGGIYIYLCYSDVCVMSWANLRSK